MTPTRLAVTLLAFPALLAGCAAFQRDAIAAREDTLAEAGFTKRLAATVVQADMLATLPPNRISQRVEGEHVSYLYPDPVRCKCLFVGGQDAYGRYQRGAILRNVARDQIDAAQLDASFAWDWAPWGGYGPAFY